MVTMAIGVAIYHGVKKKLDPEETENKEAGSTWITPISSFFIWVGAGLAIPGWNAFQEMGDQIGLTLKMTVHHAGYFSSLFPGIIEGPIQGIASIVLSHIINKSWKHFKMKTFLRQILIFATFGAIPGNIWQLAYQAITDQIPAGDYWPVWLSVLVLGFGLAFAVYLANIAFGAGYERIINESHLIIELDVIEEGIKLDANTIEEENDHLVSYNGRAGAPNKGDIKIVRKNTK
jgi:hypothetical protein